jgi:hypothetical protein
VTRGGKPSRDGHALDVDARSALRDRKEQGGLVNAASVRQDPPMSDPSVRDRQRQRRVTALLAAL